MATVPAQEKALSASGAKVQGRNCWSSFCGLLSSPIYELTLNVQKQSPKCPHVKTQTQLDSSWDLKCTCQVYPSFLVIYTVLVEKQQTRVGLHQQEAGMKQVCQLAGASAASSMVL